MGTTRGVAVGEGAFLNEGQGLEPFVRMRPKWKSRIARRVSLGTVVVQKQKGIHVGQCPSGKRPLGVQSPHGFIVGGDESEKLGRFHDRGVCRGGAMNVDNGWQIRANPCLET